MNIHTWGGVGLFLLAAAVVQADTFELESHPKGGVRPPLYGLRLDKLFDKAGVSHELFTFDFSDPTSSMFLEIDGTGPTVRIFGKAYGGLDTGSSYGDALYRGLWEIDFTYNSNVQLLSSGGALVTAEDQANNKGSITPLFNVGGNPATKGVPISLWDEEGNEGFSFRFDDDNHRLGSTPLYNTGVFVGYGWLNHGGAGNPTGDPDFHIKASDWIFVGRPIPEPSPLFMVAYALFVFSVRLVVRRRRDRRDAPDRDDESFSVGPASFPPYAPPPRKRRR